MLTVAPDATVARRLATSMVDERLAACVSILAGVTSIFRWDGSVQEESEVMLLAKTTTDTEPILRARLAELHPYDVPEILSLPVADGHAPYLQWIREEVSGH